MQRLFRMNLGRRVRELRPEQTTAEYARHQRRHLWLMTLVLALALFATLSINPPSIPGLQPGFPSPVSVQANRTLTFESKWRTDRERARVENDPSTIVYREDPTTLIEQRTQLNDLLQSISQIREDPSLDRAAKRERLSSLPNSTLVISPTLAAQLSQLDDEEWAAVRQQSLDLYDRAVRENNYTISDQAIVRLRNYSLPYWSSLYVRNDLKDLVVLLSGSFLKVNQVVDEQATQQSRQAARDAVKPVVVTVLEGESIVRQGDVITPDVQEKLEAFGFLESDTNWWYVAGQALLATLIAGVFGIYLRKCQRPLWMIDRPLIVIVALFALTALAARLVLPVSGGWTYAFPLAATALLLAALFNSELALVSAALLSLTVAFIGASDFSLGATLLLASMAGVFVVGRPERSLTFLLAGVVVAAVTALTQLGFSLLGSSEPRLEHLVTLLIFSGVNGALSAIIALGLYNLTGLLSGIITPFQLMELAHPAQPLLRRLMREAPGTYYHSIAVGNLAESAAEAIGADALLLRVAAYYHDIGKTIRPYFFTDNQSDRENVHNELDPQTSAAIIADHVREGVKLARDAGLPKQIVDFIPSHHGTTLITHFYQLALQQQDSVSLDDFRYPGPRPRTKEQAILMLADTVEATVRSKAQHGSIISARDGSGNGRANGKQTLEELVNAMIDERLRSGQLDESPLTLHDLAKIRQAFISTLQGIYHPRVEYTPQVVKQP